jgi:predicted ATPase
MFEAGARPHPPQDLYKSYLAQSQVFVGIYWQSYGWVAPGTSVSGLEDEYNLSSGLPSLIYVKDPAPNREPALQRLLSRIREANSASYVHFTSAEELEELVENDLALLLSERFESPDRAGPLARSSQAPRSSNVPVPRSLLIDRDNELADAGKMLLRDDIALITLTGPGGIGKSRLAIEIARNLLDSFEDGVYLVTLEALSDPGLVVSTIAETLGIRETPGGRSAPQMLKEFLQEKQLLLLIDNFEHVVQAAPDLSKLLEACPRLKIMVTSRIPLRLRAERELPVPALAVPTPEQSADVADLSQFAAVELFVQRAQAVKADFAVTNANAPAIAEICQRLDGLPLAIELAAARINLLTPEGLLARLEHRFDLLRGGTRDLPDRQRTLRAAIDWSYNLLNEPERELFRRLSIFAGGWTLEAAQTVCALEGELAQDLDDSLTSLLENSLVIRHPDSGAGPRFGMLNTIHDYAHERLMASDEAVLVRDRHAEYCLHFVRTVAPLARSAERVRWQQVMEQEFGNIRSVFDWICRTGKRVEIGEQIAIALGWYWVIQSHIAEGQHWCTEMMALSDKTTPKARRPALLYWHSMLAWAQGDYSSALKAVDGSLKLLSELDDTSTEGKRLLANALVMRGLLASSARDLPKAAAMCQRGVELFREIHDQWHETMALSWLGDIAQYENDRERAVALHNQSTELGRIQGDPWLMMLSLISAGQVAILDGDLEKARAMLREAEALLRQTGDRWNLSWALNDLGHIALVEDGLDEAASCFLEAVTLANTLGNLSVLIVALVGASALIARRSKNPTADQPEDPSELIKVAHLCGATVPLISRPGIFVWLATQHLYDSAIAKAKSLVGPDVWERAYNEGQSMPFDEAIALAIQSLNGR